MPITLDDVNDALALQPEEVPGHYTDRDSLLYDSCRTECFTDNF